jgi:hypothetical protein
MMKRTSAVAIWYVLTACSSGEKTELRTNRVDFPSTARVIVWLWGYDNQVADLSASLIRAYDEPANQGPILLEIPDEPHRLIDQGLGNVPQERASFYFSVYVDLNGDAQLCPGDLRQQVDDLPFYNGAPPETIDAIFTPIETGNACMATTPLL